MSECCVKHTANRSVGHCCQCGESRCEECMVFPFGERRPPMCIPCALAFAGVRHRSNTAVAPGGRARRFGRRKEVVTEVSVRDEEHFDPTVPLFDHS